MLVLLFETHRILNENKLSPHPHTNLTLPVSNSCIMPCLTWRALDSFPSRAVISASMSLRISAMAVCSEYSGKDNLNFLIFVIDKLGCAPTLMCSSISFLAKLLQKYQNTN